MASKLWLKVPDMSCAGCAATVRGTLSDEPGVTGVEIVLEDRKVLIEYDESGTSPDIIKGTISDIGFTSLEE